MPPLLRLERPSLGRLPPRGILLCYPNQRMNGPLNRRSSLIVLSAYGLERMSDLMTQGSLTTKVSFAAGLTLTMLHPVHLRGGLRCISIQTLVFIVPGPDQDGSLIINQPARPTPWLRLGPFVVPLYRIEFYFWAALYLWCLTVIGLVELRHRRVYSLSSSSPVPSELRHRRVGSDVLCLCRYGLRRSVSPH